MEKPDPGQARARALADFEEVMAAPMAALGLLWLALLVFQLVEGPTWWVTTATVVIWAVFLVDFLVMLALAPDKARWLPGQWVVIASLALPPFRVFGLLRFVRLAGLVHVAREATLLRLVAGFNQGMSALRRTLRRRKAGYAAALTTLVVFVGAAGMFVLERDVPGTLLVDYWGSVWWTAMLVTTIGSDYWPKSPGGRALCLVLAVYGFAIFGYVTAAIASVFVGDEKPDA